MKGTLLKRKVQLLRVLLELKGLALKFVEASAQLAIDHAAMEEEVAELFGGEPFFSLVCVMFLSGGGGKAGRPPRSQRGGGGSGAVGGGFSLFSLLSFRTGPLQCAAPGAAPHAEPACAAAGRSTPPCGVGGASGSSERPRPHPTPARTLHPNTHHHHHAPVRRQQQGQQRAGAAEGQGGASALRAGRRAEQPRVHRACQVRNAGA